MNRKQFIYPVLVCIAAVSFVAGLPAYASTPSEGVAVLNVQGSGFASNQSVTLSTGPNQQLTAQSDVNGNAFFQNLKYTPTEELTFVLSFQATGPNRNTVPNKLLMDLNPFTGAVKIQGNATKAASIVVNLSAQDSKTMVANQDGYFQGNAYSTTGFSSGKIKIIASIVNVAEQCCPRSFKPFAPVTITIQGDPVRKAEAKIVQQTVTASIEKEIPSLGYAISSPVYVPDSMVQQTWLNGFAQFTNRVNEAIIAATTSLGTFFDAQNNMDAARSLQERRAAAAKTYAPSEALCRFGTMGQALAASQAISDSNKLVLSNTLLGRERAASNTVYGDPGDQLKRRYEYFRQNYCDKTSANDALKKSCDVKTDRNLDSDVNYTKQIDVPLTLDVDYTNGTSGQTDKDEEGIMAMADNLFPPQPLPKAFADLSYKGPNMRYRSLQAIRSVAKNSFISLVADKAKTTSQMAPYIGKLMESLGVSADQAPILMGDKPSYFSQMEVLTKKLYQSPAFFVNLVDTPASVERQRAAMRAIKLQQGADLAETVKRREMLLAVLLELKLRERAQMVNQKVSNISAN